MKQNELENMLNNLNVPETQNIAGHGDFKIPLLSYKRSSKAGLWLLIIPLIVAVTMALKASMGLRSGYFNFVQKFFAEIDNNNLLTYLIPVIFVGLPLTALVVNFLAICHFQKDRKARELLITVKLRAWNIIILLVSFAVLVYFLLPDKLSFG